MSDSGLAKFQFSDYRINQLSLWCSPKLDLFAQDTQDPWDINVAVSPPHFYSDIPMYVGGVQIQVEKRLKLGGATEEPAIRIVASIIGQFPVTTNSRFPEEQEQMLAKVQIPAILFPYLRSAISSLMTNAGFNKMILPLINLHQIAKNSADKIQIVEISGKKV